MDQIELFNHLSSSKPFNSVQTNDEYWIELLVSEIIHMSSVSTF